MLAHRPLKQEHARLEKQHCKGPDEGAHWSVPGTAQFPERATWNSGETEEVQAGGKEYKLATQRELETRSCNAGSPRWV